MKLLNFLAPRPPALRIPVPLVAPVMQSLRVDLLYHRPRSGGDFFDALTAHGTRLIFLLMDIAGRRASALDLAAFVQDEFRSRTPELFPGVVNEAEALSELCLHLNRAILATAGRAHMTAAFLGVLDGDQGILAYINAGHVPGLVLEPDSSEFLQSTGLPLGLFSHATHEASYRVIPRDGALLLASRGVVEARSESGIMECIGRNTEFGAEGLLSATSGVPRIAQSLCRKVLDSAIVHASRQIENDMSVVAISRDADEITNPESFIPGNPGPGN